MPFPALFPESPIIYLLNRILLELSFVVFYFLPVRDPEASWSSLVLHLFHELLQFNLTKPFATGLILFSEYFDVWLFAEPKFNDSST